MQNPAPPESVLKRTWPIFAAMIAAGVLCPTLYMKVAAISYFSLVAGLSNRRTARPHAFFMGTGIAIDLCVVLGLEIQRAAVKTAVDFEISALQATHIVASLFAVIFYLPTVFFGIKRLRGIATPSQKTLHLRLGIIAFVFRTVGFFFMFAWIGRHT